MTAHPFQPGDRVRFQFAQCGPMRGEVLVVLAHGKTLAVHIDGQPHSLPPTWVAASMCERSTP